MAYHENVDEVRDLFDRTARTYDVLNHLFSFNVDNGWRKKLIRRSLAGSGARVLDLCTGTGDVAISFAKSVDGAKVVGLDFSREMLERGRRKIEHEGLDARVRFEEGDALNLSYPPGSFDVVCNSFGLRTLTNRPAAIAEMARVARTGGRVLALEFLPPPRTLFGALYSFHLHTLMPLLGGTLSGYRQSYTYLSETVDSFPSAEEIAAMMRSAGLSDVGYDRLTGGIAYLFYGTKSRAGEAPFPRRSGEPRKEHA
ncbi:MAG TPA: ubiquinone/menaquinone biosynthesis methyltransferase [Spirochaetia bacterium]|nr:ubiquinone/menaquinone biosynthesis methyltransferase [Spirochaetia bacterium]